MPNEGAYLAQLDAALKQAMDDGADKVAVADVRRLVGQLSSSLAQTENDPGRAAALADLEISVFNSAAQRGAELEKAARAEAHAWDLKLFDSVITHGQASLKAIFLVSGGAAAALLAFLGHLVSEKADAIYVHAAVAGVEWFGAALVCATVAQGLTWISQAFYAVESSRGPKWRTAGDVTRAVVAIAGLAAIILVVHGIARTATPFEGYALPPPLPCAAPKAAP